MFLASVAKVEDMLTVFWSWYVEALNNVCDSDFVICVSRKHLIQGG